MDYQDPLNPMNKQKRPGQFSLRRLSMMRLPWYVLVVSCCAVLLMGWVLAGNYDQGIHNLRLVIDQADDLVFEKEREILRLSEQVRLAETVQFIASEARTKYGYLFPGEIRFVVTNPEVLGLLPDQEQKTE